MRICCFVSIWLLTVNIGGNPVRSDFFFLFARIDYFNCCRLDLLEGFAQFHLDHVGPCRGYTGGQPLPFRVVIRGVRRARRR